MELDSLSLSVETVPDCPFNPPQRNFILMPQSNEGKAEEKYLPIRWLCLSWWTKYLVRTTRSSCNVDEIHGEINQFFTIYLLFWTEVPSLTGYLDVGVYAINDIGEWHIAVSLI